MGKWTALRACGRLIADAMPHNLAGYCRLGDAYFIVCDAGEGLAPRGKAKMVHVQARKWLWLSALTLSCGPAAAPPQAPAPDPTTQPTPPPAPQPVANPTTGCRTYKKLPRTTFLKSTLVEDDCLEIPDGTNIMVQQSLATQYTQGGAGPDHRPTFTRNDAPLALTIVAHKDLKIGKNVTINASGLQGRVGNDACGRWDGANCTGEVIFPHCVSPGQECLCPGNGSPAEKASVAGGQGDKGFTGGAVRIVARTLSMPTTAGASVFVVSGGPGGGPGKSGRQSCSAGGCSQASGACPGPNSTSGAGGTPGSVAIVLGDPNGGSMQSTIDASITPKPATSAVVIDATEDAFVKAVRDATAAATAGGFDQVPGV
jgi:hypothetical protein